MGHRPGGRRHRTDTGSWKLTDDSGGQGIELSLTHRTGIDMRAARPTDETSVSVPPPTTYTWHLHVDRDQNEGLRLFFFHGDPDVGNTYVLSRPRA
ncbi:hypothetical protein [Streptomyces sp. NPDC006527]|uniref:hypothetical protein n=1 Tax=Streptomyces sp. NPDC006527 TaxID=3364749 RepID=UPI0036C57D44